MSYQKIINIVRIGKIFDCNSKKPRYIWETDSGIHYSTNDQKNFSNSLRYFDIDSSQIQNTGTKNFIKSFPLNTTDMIKLEVSLRNPLIKIIKLPSKKKEKSSYLIEARHFKKIYNFEQIKNGLERAHHYDYDKNDFSFRQRTLQGNQTLLDSLETSYFLSCLDNDS